MADVTEWTADQICEAISLALRERDLKAVVGLMHLLAVRDPERAQFLYDFMTMSAGDNDG